MIDLLWPVAGLVALIAAGGVGAWLNHTFKQLGRKEEEVDHLKDQLVIAKEQADALSKPRPTVDKLRRISDRMRSIREESGS
jgi:hypothetical protein